MLSRDKIELQEPGLCHNNRLQVKVSRGFRGVVALLHLINLNHI